MIRNKRKSNRITAILLVLVMFVGILGGVELGQKGEIANAAISSTASGTGYTEMTFSDFGISNQTIAGGQTIGSANNAITATNGWNKIAISGFVTLPANATDATGLYIGGKNVAIVSANSNQWGVMVNGSWLMFTSATAQLRGGTVLLRLEIDLSGSDYYIKIYVNKTLLGTTPAIAKANMGDGIIYATTAAGETMGVHSYKEYGSSRIELTFSDFSGFDTNGSVSSETASGTHPYVSANGLSKVAFTGWVMFPARQTATETIGNVVRFGNLASFCVQREKKNGLFAFDPANIGTSYWAQRNYAPSSLLGYYVKLRFQFTVVNTNDYSIDVFIDDQLYETFTISNGVAEFSEWKTLVLQAYTNNTMYYKSYSGKNRAVSTKADESATADTTTPTVNETTGYTELTFSDFGLISKPIGGTDTTTETIEGSYYTGVENLESWDNVAISGFVTMPSNANTSDRILIGGPNIQIRPGSSTQWGVFNASTNEWLSFCPHDAGDIPIVGATTALRVEINAKDSNYVLKLYIDNTYASFATVPKNLMSDISLEAIAAAGHEIRMTSYYEKGSGYAELTFHDFENYTMYGAIEGENVQGQHSYLVSHGLDKVAFEGYVKFPSEQTETASADNHVRFGDLVSFHVDGSNPNRMMAVNPTDSDTVYWTQETEDEESLLGRFLKLRYEFDVVDNTDVQVKVYIEGKHCGTFTRDGGVEAIKGNAKLVLQAYNGMSMQYAAYREDRTLQDAVYDLTKYEKYLLIGDNIYVNGVAKDAGSVLTKPGDYEVQYTADGYTCKQKVVLYKIGDVDLDGTVTTASDVQALDVYLAGDSVSKAALEAADMNNDEVVDTADRKILDAIANDSDQTARYQSYLKKYFPASLTFDFLGGDEVMPVFGFFGPTDFYSASKINLLQDQYFKKIKDVGVNVITNNPYPYNYDLSFKENVTERTLDLADKNKLAYFIDDSWLNTNRTDLTIAPRTAEEVGTRLGAYAYHPSYIGSFIMDEPSRDGFTTADWPETRQWCHYKNAAANMNQYVNTNGYLNHCPEDAPWFLGTDGTPDITIYSDYWDKYIAEGNPHVLSVDDYPFTDKDTEDVTNASGYFTSLLTIRQKALDHNLPFWTYVQAGGQFKGPDAIINGSSTEGERASREETLWNVNTCLATGSKGIGWFSLTQWDYLVQNDVDGNYDLNQNSLIDLYGGKTPYYDWAKEANTQVQAVDDVLMKAQTKGIIATGGYAWTELKEAVDHVTPVVGGVPLISVAGTNNLSSVTASDSTYGAMIGCFDYKDAEAYYVVNYNTTPETSQTVTLKYKDDCNLRITKEGETTKEVGSQSVLNIPAGEAVLVVIEPKEVSEDDEEEETKLKHLPAITYDMSKQPEYLLIGEDITVNGTERLVGDTLTKPGDYLIQYTAKGTTYRQQVGLYLVGDLDLDGNVTTTSDLSRMQSYLEEGKAFSNAARMAADMNNDNVVDEADFDELSRIVNASDSKTALKKSKDKYHVPASYYDFLGGDEVMPVFGFFGPFDWPDANPNNLLKDDVFKRIKDVGVNLISYTPYDYYNEDLQEGKSNVDKTLDFTDKYGIGYYLCDDRLNTKYDYKPAKYDLDATPNTPAQTAEYLSGYAYHPSYLGANIMDEPSKDGYAKNGWPESRNWKYFKDAAEGLNRYVNYEGYVNHCPEDAPWFLAEDDVTPDINLYSEYWDQFVEEAKPHVLSIDDYPFTDRETEDVTNAKGYFTSLLTVRQKALDNDLPFWTYVQAGGQFKGVDAIVNGTSTIGERASEEETYWNVNTCLATGSKGIGWFTLVQYKLLVETQPGVYDLDMNGLIDLEGNETPYYPWAKKANRQIQACDEVLMKAESKGIIATEGYAWTEIKEAADYVTPVIGGVPLISAAGTTHLKKVVSDDTTYGAMVGCFDYKDTEAYYVVNYNTTAGTSQKIRLSYNDRCRIRCVQDGVTTYSETDQSVLTIPAGEAVLVVVEGKVHNAPAIADDGECYEISHRDFVNASGVSIEDKKYEYTSNVMLECGTYKPLSVGPTPNTLDGTMFSADVTYHGTSYIRYGGTDPNGWYGLEIRPVNNGYADFFEVRYIHSTDGVVYVDYKTKYIQASSVGLDSAWDREFHLQIALRLVDHDGGGAKDDIEASIYINGKLANGEKFYYDGYGAFLGNALGIISESTGGYVLLETHEFEADDYTCITTSDIGVGNTNQMKETTGVYEGTSMDKVAFSSYVDFGTDGKIHFAGTGEGEEDTITLYRYANTMMAVDTNGLYTGRGYAYDCIWGIPIPASGKFHLLVTTDFIDYDRDGYKEDLKLRFWIDGKAVYGNIIVSDGVYHMGRHFAFVSSDSTLALEEAAMKRTLSDAVYDLTDIGEYSVDASTTYDKPGEYGVKFEEGYTQYEGNIVLYRKGDANLDNTVTSKDLVRQKKSYKNLTIQDIENSKISEGAITGAEKMGTFSTVDTLVDTAVEMKVSFPSDGSGSVVLGGTIGSWYGIYFVYHTKEKGLTIEWRDDVEGVIVGESTYIKDASLGDRELNLRVELEANGDDLILHIYVDGEYRTDAVFEGQAPKVTNHFLVYSTNAEKPLTLKSVNYEKAREESLDADADGAFSLAKDADALRNILLGEGMEKTLSVGTIGNVKLSDSGDNFQAQKLLEDALVYHKMNEAKVIAFAGDLTANGTTAEQELFDAIVEKVYRGVPQDMRPQLLTTQVSESVTVDGYTCITLSDDSTASWLSGALGEASQGKPIFVVSNQSPSAAYEDVLKDYPQVVLLTADEEVALEGDSGIYQEDYTVVNMGSLSGGELFDGILSQTTLVQTAGKKVAIQKYDVLRNRRIEGSWVEDNVFDKENYTYTVAYRNEKKTAPQFPESAKICTVWNEDMLFLEFDAAEDDELVYCYELTGSSGKTWKLPGSFYDSKGSSVCKYQLSGVDKTEELQVVAIDAYGNRSEAIVAY